MPHHVLSVALVQRRTIHVLLLTQVVFAVALAMAGPVAALLAQQLTGSATLAGLAQATTVTGGVLTVLPLAALTIARGRRVAITAGYLAGALGAAAVVAAGMLASYPLLLGGAVLVGTAVTAGLQARFAAADLAAPHQRGRAIGTVVWASTLGGILGPSLAGPAGQLAHTLHLPALTGPFLVIATGLLLAAGVAAVGLRPDPLLTARARAGHHDPAPTPRLRQTLGVLAQIPAARRSLAALAVVHAVMVSVMNMASLHLHHGGATLRVVGLVISVHLAGMFLLAPVFGWLADRLGAAIVLALGLALLLTALGVLQATSQQAVGVVAAGLWLLGLGWSAGFVAGSSLLTAAVPAPARPGVQAGADLVMQLAAAGGALLAGTVVAAWQYAGLARLAAVPVLLLAARLAWSPRLPAPHS
jgi:MFS family permease